jgi:hypothetical protein
MNFLVTAMWAFLSFFNPGLGQHLSPAGPALSARTPATVQGVHHARGRAHTMDSNAGGPA